LLSITVSLGARFPVWGALAGNRQWRGAVAKASFLDEPSMARDPGLM
jgi:hypothetical protein